MLLEMLDMTGCYVLNEISNNGEMEFQIIYSLIDVNCF